MTEEKEVERFVVRQCENPDHGLGVHWDLVDRVTGATVGSDGGEPEDQLLIRDWKWVAPLCNRLAAEIDQLKAERDELKVKP